MSFYYGATRRRRRKCSLLFARGNVPIYMDEVGMRSSLISRKAKSNDKGPVETFHLFFIEM